MFGTSSFSDVARSVVSASTLEAAGEELDATSDAEASDDEASTAVLRSAFSVGGAAAAELMKKAKAMDAM